MEPDDYVEVLIVGANVTGLMLALELAQQRSTFRIIDSRHGVAAAATKHAMMLLLRRDLELLGRHGDLSHALLASSSSSSSNNNNNNSGDGSRKSSAGTGTALSGVDVHLVGCPTARIEFRHVGGADTAFPLPLWIPQADVETMLEERLVRAGAKVERRTQVEELVQDAAGVAVTIVTKDSGQQGEEETARETVLCKFVVGCDDAGRRAAATAQSDPRSRAPQTCTNDGSSHHRFVISEVRLDWQNHARDRAALLCGRGVLAALPAAATAAAAAASPTPRDDSSRGAFRLLGARIASRRASTATAHNRDGDEDEEEPGSILDEEFQTVPLNGDGGATRAVRRAQDPVRLSALALHRRHASPSSCCCCCCYRRRTACCWPGRLPFRDAGGQPVWATR